MHDPVDEPVPEGAGRRRASPESGRRRPLRIVQVANFVHARSGGIRVAIDALSEHYVASGHDVMVVRPGARHHLVRDDIGRVLVQLPGVALPASGGYRMLLRRPPVASLIASWRPDVVEVDDKTTLAWAGAFARTLGARSVMFSHERLDLVVGDHLGAPGVMRRVVGWHQRRAVEGFDLVLCPSRFAAAELDGLPVARAVVPLGVDLARFHPDRRHSVARDTAPRRLVMASRLTRDKQPLLAVAAVGELRRRGLDVELLIAGAGPLERAVVAESRRLGGGVRLLGHVADRDHLAALLASADAVVCPGRRETFGLAALEALASGTAVAGMAESAVAELVVDGAGVTCAPDAAALADGLADLLAGDRDAQRRSARRRAEEFRWSRAGDAILAHFHTLVGDGPRHGETAAARRVTTR